ncbi:peptidoglycan-binding protein [Kitasatospora sp. NPDC058201]|uniref:peptidoglycan-binding protein n=1 Tax=Streptomycetaceae TaxID=2062 RepID=UPI002E79AF2A|nr:peptidoglycan-binding protein [Streptomyces sp. BE303]MED7951357.1 peptidoglycan-binding protein [Streptomyces sp. BE303]
MNLKHKIAKGAVAVTVAAAATFGLAATASATPNAPAVQASGSQRVLAVNNLGLNTTQAQNVQHWLRGYWGYGGALDGLAGTETVKALQRLPKDSWGYTGAIDGIAGSGTQTAFRTFANRIY